MMQSRLQGPQAWVRALLLGMMLAALVRSRRASGSAFIEMKMMLGALAWAWAKWSTAVAPRALPRASSWAITEIGARPVHHRGCAIPVVVGS